MKHLYSTLLLRLRTLLIAACLLPAGISAQAPGASKFPDNPNEFVDKLGEFMTASKRPDMEEAYSVFKKGYKSGRYSEEDMKHVIRLSNMLADQKLSPFPYFKDYINAVSAARSDPDTALFNRWHGLAEQSIGSIEKGRTKPIRQFLEFSVDFLEHRALKTGEGGSVTWKIKGGSSTSSLSETNRNFIVTTST